MGPGRDRARPAHGRALDYLARFRLVHRLDHAVVPTPAVARFGVAGPTTRSRSREPEHPAAVPRPADPDRLPTPTRPRYTLLRIGIQNIWEYDVTTRFVARDGRLLLRGQNESGKTKRWR